MSDHNLQHSKNRIAPPFLKKLMVLILVLSSIVLLPNTLSVANLDNITNSSANGELKYYTTEDLPLAQEKVDVIVGKNDSLITMVELKGGKVRIPFDLSRTELALVNQIDFLVSNQSSFSKIWTNPLWKVPDGLVIRITARTQDYNKLLSIYQFIDGILRNNYGVISALFNLNSISETDTVFSLISQISYEQALTIFQEIFVFEDQSNDGNIISIMSNLLSEAPSVYAFGFSIKKRLGTINQITRSIVFGEENMIPNDGFVRNFHLYNIYGEKFIPDKNALLTTFSFHLPFLVNITTITPPPDNVGSTATGSFDWILKFVTTTIYPIFDLEIVYSPFNYADFIFPRVTIANSYSDFQLENNGILNMTYSIENTGTDIAYNTTVILPVPRELQAFIQEGLVIPVLKDTIQINENFSSFIDLRINYNMYDFMIQIADIKGWYENTTTLAPERWLDIDVYDISEYVSIHCTNGISSDMLLAIEKYLNPIIVSYEIGELVDNMDVVEPILIDSLSSALEEAYGVILEAFYENKTIFQFDSSDFNFNTNLFGGYLEYILPQLDVNDTKEVSWTIYNIPTSADRFGAITRQINTAGSVEYTVFQTVEHDYKELLLSVFAAIDSAGRFLSTYDAVTDAFVSIGSRFHYTDSSGRLYFGLTNGLNLQIGDDEAVLESILTLNSTVYRVGDSLPFSLDITNFGTIDAHEIHVDIVNLRLNALWLPTDVIVVKSFDIDSIGIGEHLKIDFSINANSYIGLNTYVALISFTSDQDQISTLVVDLWTGEMIPWKYSGETFNILTSTLTFGILFPPEYLENELRPSFPVPEIIISSDYEINEQNRELNLNYKVANEGLSITTLSLHQVFPKDQGELEYLNCTLVTNDNTIELEPTIVTRGDYHLISYTNITLEPGDYIIVEAQLRGIEEEFIIPPLIVNYSSLYQIQTTDFRISDNQAEADQAISTNLKVKNSPSTVSEGNQNQFIWSSFSILIHIDLPFSSESEQILFSSLPWIYPVLSTALISSLLLIAIVISRNRK